MSSVVKDGGFQPTRWSLVIEARDQSDADSSNDGGEQALESLCRIYWTPLFVFVRRQGYSPEESEDLVQGFFAKILASDFFASAEQEKGRLRSYLLNALKRHLVNEHRARTAEKRGGKSVTFSVDAEEGENSSAWEISSAETPESAYEYRWVRALLDHCMARLRQQYADQGKEAIFEALCPLLTPGGDGSIAEAAAKLHSSEGTTRVALSRFRKKFSQVVEEEVRATLLPGDDFEEELKYLMEIASRRGDGRESDH